MQTTARKVKKFPDFKEYLSSCVKYVSFKTKCNYCEKLAAQLKTFKLILIKRRHVSFWWEGIPEVLRTYSCDLGGPYGFLGIKLGCEDSTLTAILCLWPQEKHFLKEVLV